MVDVDPQVYYTAASSCHSLADDTASQLGLLKANLTKCEGMAGNYPQVATWSSSYASHSKDFMNGAAVLANALENLSDILNVAGHNWAMANYNANRDPNKGSAPVAPARSHGPVCHGETVLPPTATGDNGDGLDTNIAGLLEKSARRSPTETLASSPRHSAYGTRSHPTIPCAMRRTRFSGHMIHSTTSTQTMRPRSKGTSQRSKPRPLP